MKPRVIIYGLPKSGEIQGKIDLLKNRIREAVQRDDVVIHLNGEYGTSEAITPRRIQCTLMLFNFEAPAYLRRDLPGELNSIVETWCEECAQGSVVEATCEGVLDDLRVMA